MRLTRVAATAAVSMAMIACGGESAAVATPPEMDNPGGGGPVVDQGEPMPVAAGGMTPSGSGGSGMTSVVKNPAGTGGQSNTLPPDQNNGGGENAGGASGGVNSGGAGGTDAMPPMGPDADGDGRAFSAAILPDKADGFLTPF
ncbi:MAG: hypothetical protein RJA70_2481, partial [Pseudomonadota bacterium]